MKSKLRQVISTLIFVVIACVAYDIGYAQGDSYWENVPEKVRERNAYKRFEWFYRQRAIPNDAIPEGAIERARDQEIAKEKLRSPSERMLDVTWSPIGPTGIVSIFPSQWGVVSGRVRAIAVHPTDPNTLYLGAAAGGIWKTTNGGTSWQDVGFDLASLTFGAIAIDPSNPNTVYAGAGESMRYFNTTTYSGKGLFKSINGGLSWTQITSGFGTTTHFGALKVSPTNSNTIFAALGSAYWHNSSPGNEGLWRSTDAGLSWTRTLNVDDGFDIVPHPTIANRVYGATGGAGTDAGFYRSTDNGATWTKITTGLPASSAIDRIQIALPTSSPSTIYALIYQGNNQNTLYKSTNDGDSWSSVWGPTTSTQGWYDLLLAVNPNDVNEVYVGDAELRRSANGGTSFSYVGGSYWSQSMHVDFHFMVFAPSNPSIRYVGCDGGIYRSADAGGSWVHQNSTLPTLQYYRLGSHPTNQNIMTGGAQDNGVFKTTNGGSGTWTLVSTGDGMECFYDYSNPNTVFAATQSGGLIRSTTGGDYGSFSSVKPSTSDSWAWTAPFFIHPTNSSTIYTASRRPWRSTNSGTNWTDLTGAAITSVSITSMAQSPVDPNNMVLAASEWTNTPAVMVSSNGGTSWITVTGNIGGTQMYIGRVVFHPTQANTIFVVRSGFSSGNKIYRSTNLGTNWTNISGDLPDVPHNDLFIDPLNVSEMYTANDLGVYRTTNAGTTWLRQGNNLPYVPAMDFDYFSSGGVRLLRVATHGRSAYQASLVVSLPAPPTLASPADGATNQPTTLTLSWNASAGASTYRLQVATDAGFGSLVLDDATLTGTSRVVGPLNNLTQYHWRMSATNASGTSAYSASRNFTTIIAAPASPTLASPANGATNQLTTLTLSWNASAGASTYRLQVATDAGFSSLVLDDATLTGTSRVVGPLNNLTQYYWRVNATNAGGTSAYSSARNFTTVQPTITVTAPNGGETWGIGSSQTITWTSSNMSGNVKIELSRNGGSSYDVLLADTPNDGSESWTVAGPPTTSALVRISSLSFPSVTDLSNTIFAIATTYVFLTDIIVRDNGTGTDRLFFGTAGGATDGIDPQFGEEELPPVPPAGAFDVRWQIAGTLGSLRDVRQPLGGALAQIIYTAQYQVGLGGYPVTLRWNRADLPSGLFILRDLFGGMFFKVNMRLQDSLIITSSALTSFQILYKSGDTLRAAVSNRWNVVSLPLTVSDRRATAVFPAAISGATTFNGSGYVTDSLLQYGVGYWMKFNSADTLTFGGSYRDLDTLELSAGWQTIGTISYPVPTASIIQIPSGIVASPFFGYTPVGYATATTLQPMQGYWVKLSAPGRLVLIGNEAARKRDQNIRHEEGN